MAKHLVSVVGRRMEAVVEVEAETEEQARTLALEQAETLNDYEWYVADEFGTLRVERLMSKAEEAAAGVRRF